MSYNGSGTFVINTAGQPVVSGTVISSTAFNALTADLANGLSTAITKDGQTTPTANIPMGNNKITALANGTAATDAANLGQVQSTTAKLINSISGADTITGTLSPTLTAYAAGQMFYFVAAGDNTGAVTLNINSLGAKSVTRDGAVALAASDIKSGEVVVVVYDGTQFQVVSQLNSSGDARFANVSIASALNVGGVSTLTGAVNIAGAVSIASSMSVVGVFTATGSSALNGGVVINEPGADVDFRVESDTDTHCLFVDASTNNVGIGTSSPAAKLDVRGAPNTIDDPALKFQVTVRDNATAFNATPAAGIHFSNIYNSSNALAGMGGINCFKENTTDGNFAGALALYTRPNGGAITERLRIDSAGNVGIGTSSPQYKLQVSADDTGNTFPTAAAVNVTNTNTSGFGKTMGVNFSVGTGAASEIISGVYGVYTNYTSSVGGALAFVTNNGSGSLAEKMRLDSSGNLGIGVTPSAWGSLYKAIQNGQSAFMSRSGGSDCYILSNNYYDGTNFKYINTAAAAYYRQDAGTHAWLTAPSGTAGNTITFTQAMTLTAAGDLGVGETSPDTRAHIYGANTGGRGQLYIQSSGTVSRFVMANSSDAQALNTYGDSSTSLVTWDAGSGYSFRWTVADTERARITSGGDLLVGTTSQPTSADNRVAVVGTRGIDVKSEGGATATTATFWNNATTGDNSFVSFRTETADTSRGSITYNRGAGQVAYNVTSDVRLKDNIADAADASDKVDAIKVRQFDWKETGNHVDYGFVAQELEAVAPHAVSKPEDDEAMWSVDYSKLVPMLVKEIQSLRARSAALEAKVAALEGK